MRVYQLQATRGSQLTTLGSKEDLMALCIRLIITYSELTYGLLIQFEFPPQN